jgi:hypothetical protein
LPSSISPELGDRAIYIRSLCDSAAKTESIPETRPSIFGQRRRIANAQRGETNEWLRAKTVERAKAHQKFCCSMSATLGRKVSIDLDNELAGALGTASSTD